MAAMRLGTRRAGVDLDLACRRCARMEHGSTIARCRWTAELPMARISRMYRSTAQEFGGLLSRKQIVGKWETFRWRRSSRNHFFLASGKINDENNKATWTLEGRTLTLTWPAADAPNGAWVDSCNVSGDGKSYAGKNQQDLAIHGEKPQ